MTATELQLYWRRLRTMAARLGGEVSALHDEALQPVGAEAGEAGDAALDPEARAGEEAALALFGVEGHTLAEVNAALDRIDLGTFGICEGCGKAIPRDRLRALPYARRCVGCERAAGG
jgi:DnaK suppressor protein